IEVTDAAQLVLRRNTQVAEIRRSYCRTGGILEPAGVQGMRAARPWRVRVAKKWYNYFLSVDQPEGSREESSDTAEPRTAAQTVAEIASGLVAEPQFTAPVANPTSFEEIYKAAEITPPTHGFTILKIIDLLQSEHI